MAASGVEASSPGLVGLLRRHPFISCLLIALAFVPQIFPAHASGEINRVPGLRGGAVLIALLTGGRVSCDKYLREVPAVSTR